MNDEIILKVEGKSYGGWTSIVVEKSMFNLAGAFGFATTDIYPGRSAKWNIKLGAECVVEVNGQAIITGYVEDIPIDYDELSHNIQFGGRDNTGDLVDCSFDGDSNEWKNLKVLKVLKQLCDPFDIDILVDSTVTSKANSKWPDSVKADEGVTVSDLIFDMCKMKAMLPVSYGDGYLTLTQANTKNKVHDSLVLGRNIKRGRIEQSNKDRYKTYIVKGQGAADDFRDLFSITSPVGRHIDNVIERYRPLVIFTETKCDSGRCLERAKWEANIRAGKSRRLEYEVQGWTQSNGDVWPMNAMVQVNDNFLDIKNKELLIAALSFNVDPNFGTFTRMVVVDPKTFDTSYSAQEITTKFDFAQNLRNIANQ